eukprot:6135692-Lingulodinium_polyedra.AAC.1
MAKTTSRASAASVSLARIAIGLSCATRSSRSPSYVEGRARAHLLVFAAPPGQVASTDAAGGQHAAAGSS